MSFSLAAASRMAWVSPRRDCSQTAMVGAGNFGPAKLPKGNCDVSGKAVVLPVDCGAACRAEMKGQCAATFGSPRPSCGLTGKGDLVELKTRLVADHGALPISNQDRILSAQE